MGLVIVGARGRMGQALQEAALAAGRTIEALVDRPGTEGSSGVFGVSAQIGSDWQTALKPGRVAIDFSAPAVTVAIAQAARQHGCPLVIGTTGIDAAGIEEIRKASEAVPVVFAPNYSIGVSILLEVTQKVAAILDARAYDAEIVEAHHRFKKDSPSGTALGLAQALARGRGVNLDDVACYGREGIVGERPQGEIGIHAVRGGDVVGDHTVSFYGEGERIQIHHQATSRRTFAEGAVRAAIWLKGRGPGLYTMRHVLGFDPA
jgi:4-hydroxy-tetrahydrodipicolinate reductase